MLTLFTRERIEFNHAYQPGKGCLTAWRDLINTGLKKKYIYEFDLKGFFDNVEIPKVTELLEKWGTPKRIVYHLENINRCTPQLQSEDLVDEKNWREREKIHTTLKSGVVDPELSI